MAWAGVKTTCASAGCAKPKTPAPAAAVAYETSRRFSSWFNERLRSDFDLFLFILPFSGIICRICSPACEGKCKSVVNLAWLRDSPVLGSSRLQRAIITLTLFFPRVFVLPQRHIPRLPQVIVRRPFHECKLSNASTGLSQRHS